MRPCEQVTVWCTACVKWRLRSLVTPCPREVGASWEDCSLEVPSRLLAECQGFPEISGGSWRRPVVLKLMVSPDGWDLLGEEPVLLFVCLTKACSQGSGASFREHRGPCGVLSQGMTQ